MHNIKQSWPSFRILPNIAGYELDTGQYTDKKAETVSALTELTVWLWTNKNS